MRGTEALRALLSTADGQQSLLNWCAAPIQEVVVDSAHDLFGRASTQVGSSEAGLIELGRVAGVQSVISFLRNPTAYIGLPSTTDGVELKRKILQNPTYGADEVLRREAMGLSV